MFSVHAESGFPDAVLITAAWGLGIDDAIASGEGVVLHGVSETERFKPGAMRTADTTDPDGAPIVKKAVAFITDRGGRTSHLVVVTPELGLPAIGGPGSATCVLKDGDSVTVSCAEGDEGFVEDGVADDEARALRVSPLLGDRTG